MGSCERRGRSVLRPCPTRVRPCLNRGETSGRNPEGNRLFIPATQPTSYYLPRGPIWGSGPDSSCPWESSVRPWPLASCPWPVRGLAVSVLCPPCSQAHCSQDPCSRAPSSAPFAAVAATSANDWKQTIKHRLLRRTLAALLQRLPPLSSPSFTDARAATRSRARDRHQRSRGRRTFAFPGTTVWPHPDSCRSHGGRTRLPSRGRCTRAPTPAWPRS